MDMDTGYCCYGGCRPSYFEDALPFLALLAVTVAGRCAWLSRYAPKTPLHRIWGPWLALPAALLLFLDRGSISFGLAVHPSTSVLFAMTEVVVVLVIATLPILSFVAPLQWLARRHPEWSVPQRFVGAATATEVLWRGAALALVPFA
jgi:hypothetical protein